MSSTVLERIDDDPPRAREGAEHPCTMSLIVAARQPNQALAARISAFIRATAGYPTEVIVACYTLWPDAPPGVRVVVTGAVSRGDRLDRAGEDARGELLAFVDQDVTLGKGWQARAVELLRDPTVGAAGGPQLLPAGASRRERAAWIVLSSWFGSGPLRHRFSRGRAGSVPEMPTTNLVVKREAFRSVGGFQSPTPLGDDARLCYKLRALLGLRVLYDPGLAVDAAPPALLNPFVSLMLQWGRQRGDLWRRLPETSRLSPNYLPAIALVAGVIAIGLALWNPIARFALGAVAVAYIVAAAWLAIRSRDLPTAAIAGIGLPVTHLTYAVGFWRGFLGHSLGDISPRRARGKPLRILIFNWRDMTHPWAGGAESYMHELASRWAQANCDVGWVSERYRTGKRVEVIDGIRFHRVGGHFTVYPLAALTYLLRLRNRYDVIVDCENGIPFFTPLFSRKPVVLVVHHLHQEVFRSELPPYLRWLALWLEGWLMPRVYSRKSIVTVSPSTSNDLQRHGYDPARIVIVKNGVDLPNGEEAVQANPTPLLVHLGRLQRYKSVDVLVQAMPRVLEAFPAARLAIVGQGPERAALERLSWKLGLAASLKFHGYLDQKSRDRLLASAWLAVCASRFEGWGVVCLEANARGVPVVAARVPGLVDAVVDGVTGSLVPHGDSAKLADELIALLNDPERRMRMALAAKQWAGSHQWDESARFFLNEVLARQLPASAAVPAYSRI